MSVASRRRNIFTTASSSSGGSGTVQSVNSGTDITIDNTDPANPIVNFTGTYQDPITVVANYSALPPVATVTGQFYWCSAAQGTAWLPGTLGGTYYNSGLYYSNGVTWEFLNVPYNATQAEVNTGTNTDKFVTPSTLANYTGLTSKVASVTGTTNRISIGGTATNPTVDISSSYVGQNTITTLGTVTTGTLSTGAILGGVTVTVGSDATGDLHYRSAGGIFTRLGIGSSGQVLTVSGGLPAWATAGSGITVGTTTITSGTSGNIPYNGAGVYQESSNFNLNATENALQVGYTLASAIPNGNASIRIKTGLTGGMLLYNGTGSWPGATVMAIDDAGTALQILNFAGLGYTWAKSDFATNLMYLTDAGRLSIGIGSSPTAVLHLKAGTATAGTAPLKITNGTNLTVVENNAMENDGSNLFFSLNSTRNILAQVSGSTPLTSGRVPYVTTNGYLTNSANLTFNPATPALIIGSGNLTTITDTSVTTQVLSTGTSATALQFNNGGGYGYVGTINTNRFGANGGTTASCCLSWGNNVNAGIGINLGATTPTARLQIAAGTVTASSAPLKLTTSGTGVVGLNTTAEKGAVEFSDFGLWFTPATTRHKVVTGVYASAAPSTSVGVSITNYYGLSATNFLGDPVGWIDVVDAGGTTRKIPYY